MVRGTAQVTVNELVKTAHENESIYIPIGAAHRLENPVKIQLALIEVQTGSYFGEEHVIRIGTTTSGRDPSRPSREARYGPGCPRPGAIF